MNNGSSADNGVGDLKVMAQFELFDKAGGLPRDGNIDLNDIVIPDLSFYLG
jgi:hypothetical protein